MVEAGLTRGEVASLLGVPLEALSTIGNAKHRMDLELLTRRFGVSIVTGGKRPRISRRPSTNRRTPRVARHVLESSRIQGAGSVFRHEELLRHARPYLGCILSQSEGWTPLAGDRAYVEESQDAGPDRLDPWQFRNFLYRPYGLDRTRGSDLDGRP